MRIVHLSDTHVGYSAYNRIDPQTGLNQREVDIYDAFERAVDQILRIRPDAVVHAGDLFDSVRPSNRALSAVMDQLLRLSDAGIPTVIIAGNHSTPRLRETGSVFRLFEHIPLAYPVYQGKYQALEIGGMTLHAVPHAEPESMREALESIQLDRGRENVLTMHAGIVGLQVFRMNEFNESLVNTSYLDPSFDHIALGHYHGCVQVGENAWYSGSTERVSFKEAGEAKGFLEVDLSSRRVTFHPLHTRAMLDLELDAADMGPGEIVDAMSGILGEQDLDGAVVRLRVRSVPSSTYRSMDMQGVRDLTAGCLHFEPRLDVLDERVSVQSTGTMDSIQKEFVSFLERYPVVAMPKDDLRDLGLDYIERGLGE